jgi:hypothetical protein
MDIKIAFAPISFSAPVAGRAARAIADAAAIADVRRAINAWIYG